jgi:hypothetical protein
MRFSKQNKKPIKVKRRPASQNDRAETAQHWITQQSKFENKLAVLKEIHDTAKPNDIEIAGSENVLEGESDPKKYAT